METNNIHSMKCTHWVRVPHRTGNVWSVSSWLKPAKTYSLNPAATNWLEQSRSNTGMRGAWLSLWWLRAHSNGRGMKGLDFSPVSQGAVTRWGLEGGPSSNAAPFWSHAPVSPSHWNKTCCNLWLWLSLQPISWIFLGIIKKFQHIRLPAEGLGLINMFTMITCSLLHRGHALVNCSHVPSWESPPHRQSRKHRVVNNANRGEMCEPVAQWRGAASATMTHMANLFVKTRHS